MSICGFIAQETEQKMIQVTHVEESSESTQQRSETQSANFTTKDTADKSVEAKVQESITQNP